LRKVATPLAFLLLAVALPAGAAITKSHADLARGRIVEPDGRTIKFNARSNADGTNPRGRMSVDFRPDERIVESFKVTCLAVRANRATIIGTFKRAKPRGFRTPVSGLVLWVEDRPGAADRYEYQLLVPPIHGICQSLTVSPFLSVFKGHLTVRDGP
jgi:hypothetical protein